MKWKILIQSSESPDSDKVQSALMKQRILNSIEETVCQK